MDHIEVEMILAERHTRYGEYSSTALIAQQLKGMMHEAPSWHKLTASQREGLEMIQHKIARIVNGDPTYIDSFRDIEGYAKLIVEDMEKKHGTKK
jgi:hypothetical protein